MKKKNNKNTIPAYAFGMDQLSNYLGGANVFGSAISGLSEEGSTGDIAGSTIGSAASLAGAGLTVGGPIGAAVGGGLGLVSGLIGSIKRKKQMQALRRRKETLNKTKIGMNAAAETEGEYWDDNDLAYTFENGGILPDLAYLDNNEVVRDDYGNIVQVPNTKPGTDNHLVDASTLESVLSDKIKRPGTKNTFAKEGQILSKMTKPSKGKDKFAENTNRLNKINANKAYNKLLAEQEAVKAAKGVKPKVKGIPAYADGKGKTVDDVRSKMNADTYAAYSDFFDELGTGLNKFGEALGYFPKRIFGPLINNKNITKAVESARNTKPSATSMDYTGDTNISKVFNRSTSMNPLSMSSENATRFNIPGAKIDAQTQIINDKFCQLEMREMQNKIDTLRDEKNALQSSALLQQQTSGSPTTGAWFSYPTQTVDAITYANDEPIYVDIPLRPIESEPTLTNTYTNASNKQVTKPNITKTTTQRLSEPTIPLVNTSMTIDWDDVVTPVNIPASADEATKKRALSKPKNGYSPDWLSLAPTVYNALQSLRGPEEEPLVLNPYAGAVRSTMARRRMNIEPARLANSRSRAISNYNLANINANTGANLAARTQAAVDEYASNTNMYATKQNADNAYLGEYANTLNNLGQQFVQSENMYNDLNARNRAAARNFGATATSKLGKWSQVNRLMQNQYNRDQMTLPFLADFLSQGFTKEQVDNLLTRTRNRV